MLARRRRAHLSSGTAAATALSGSGGEPGGTTSGGLGTAEGGSTASSVSRQHISNSRRLHSVDAIIEERMTEFAPYVLPSLVNDKEYGETASSASAATVTSAGDMTSSSGAASNDVTVVEGASRQRIRISHMLLLMYLHIGSDPPDFPRVQPCAKTECWMDPMVAHITQYVPHGSGGGGGSDSIAEALERQYRSFVKDDVDTLRVVEASVETARASLVKVRRAACDGRVLVHYNGHGMPRATDLGELWMFDRERTHYVPLNILDVAELADSPTLYVLDCNSAGSVLRRWYQERMHERRPHDVFICACSSGETLPLSPSLPADMLTSCLTTPLRTLLEWYINFSHHKLLLPQVSDDMIRNIPGDLADRKTPRGELNWILGAVTDMIAWCTLPPAQFYYLFRQDATTRTIFRNVILADRLMREAGCTPVTHPPLPEEAHLHHAWELLEYTIEKALSQLPRMFTPDSTEVYETSTFFDVQLTAFEVWVESGDLSQTPEQLPCVLLALTLIAYRVRAFTLLVKYLDSGRIAGKRSIMCGILPYMSKFLTQAPEAFLIVTILWMQVIRADPAEGCAELQRSQCEKYITSFLKLDENLTRVVRVQYGQNISGDVHQQQGRDQHSSPAAASALYHSANKAGSKSTENMTSFSSPTSALAENGNGTGFDTDGRQAPYHYPRLAASPHAGGMRTSAAMADMALLGGSSGGSFASPSGGTTPTQPLQPARTSSASPRSPDQPLQPIQQPQLSSIATHAIQPGDTVYYLPVDVDLPRCKSMACYILCQLQQRGGKQCLACWNNKLLAAAFPCLSSTNAELRSWACLVLSKLFTGLRHAKNFASRECASRLDLFTRLLQDDSPIVRSSCVTLLASIVGVRADLLAADQQLRRLQMEKSLLIRLRGYLFDASMAVREELIFFGCQVLYSYRRALPEEYVGRFSEYIQEVGRQDTSNNGGGSSVSSGSSAGCTSLKWALLEADVQVKSLLNSARPTVSTLFNDAVVFDTALLSRDDLLPATLELDPACLTPESLEIVRGLLHDAALMLCTLFYNCDGATVNKSLHALATDAAPQSHRFASEALRTMSHVASMDASYYMSEADRARATWNTDMMRQLVLNMKDRKLEPYQPTSISQRGTSSSGNRNGGSDDASGSSAMPSPTHRAGDAEASDLAGMPAVARYQVLPSVVRADTVVCGAFRALEPSMVLVTKDQRISYVSYDNYDSTPVVLKSFAVRTRSLIHEVCVINDLSEQSGLLIVDKRGGFSLFKGCWDEESIPTEAAAFSACPPPPSNAWINLRTVYRTNTATLYYGGPIGPTGGTEIHALSLAEEQVTQRLEVSGNPILTCMNPHTMQRVLLAGFSDAIVRYYDDRQGQGQVGAFGLLQCHTRGGGVGVAAATTGTDSLLGVGPISGSTGWTIAAATGQGLFLFDARKLSEPVLTLSHCELYHSGSPIGGLTNAQVTEAPYVTGCSVGVHTGLIGLCFSDSTYAAYNSKGQLLNDCPVPVTSASGTSLVLPSSCIVHPLRPTVSFGGDIMFLHV